MTTDPTIERARMDVDIACVGFGPAMGGFLSTLAKQLVKFLAERFMSPEKVLQAARQFGISEEAIAQIIVFSQMRDALKQISPRYFRNPKQRDELFQTFIKTLEDLESELEDEEQEELQKQLKKKKEKK